MVTSSLPAILPVYPSNGELYKLDPKLTGQLMFLYYIRKSSDHVIKIAFQFLKHEAKKQ